MAALGLTFLLLQLVHAAVPLPAALADALLAPSPYRDPNRLIVKLSENSSLRWDNGLQGSNDVVLNGLLSTAKPLFSRSPASLQKEALQFDPEGRLPQLNRYLQIHHPNAAVLGQQLKQYPEISHVYLASLPVPPPSDVPPETPLFEQAYRHGFPEGLSIDVQHDWPDAKGQGVTIVDIEYGWSSTHEDLTAAPEDVAWGWNFNEYIYHGNAVLGLLIADHNGFGISGIAPEAEVQIVSPFPEENDYNVADAISAATDILSAGDVLLIEQQGYVDNLFCPVEVEPAVFDAIALAVAKGIIVVEPTGNGSINLDGSDWGDWFNPDVQDSGAMMVGGGASPLSGYEPRTWYPNGSAYGRRVDLQAWFDSTVTLGGPGMVDLFFPDGDVNQAYTAQFGGSSGASAMVAGISAVVSGVSQSRWEQPIPPIQLRENLAVSGYGAASNTPFVIGPQPDLRQFLWRYSLR